MKEIWKEVPNCNGHFLVNNLGIVKSIDRFVNSRWGDKIKRPERGRVMSPFIDTTGYWHIVLNHKHFKIHRLLAILFIPNPDNLPEINHINGIKTDNSLENLEWCTKKHNVRHAYKLGLANGKPGSSNPASKLNEEIVKEIMRVKGVFSSTELGQKYNVGRHVIESIYRGDTWSHLTGIKKRMRDENRIILENKNQYNYITRKKTNCRNRVYNYT